METNNKITKKIIEILVDVTGNEDLPKQLTGKSDIINEVGLDSIQMINFVLMLEDEFNIEIDFEKLDFSTLSTIDSLCNFVLGQVA